MIFCEEYGKQLEIRAEIWVKEDITISKIPPILVGIFIYNRKFIKVILYFNLVV